MDKIEELLTRGVANIIPNIDELKKLLASGKKLNVYLGIDPTTTKIHLGHAVVLRKLNEFAKFGHNVTFLIGDFTALIGDTSDKDTERPVLTPEQIQENFKTYKKQAEKIVDFSKIKVRYNSKWLDKLSSREMIRLAQQFSFGDFGSRELIKKRLGEGRRVGMHEGLYPAMQGYDSYFLDTDIQIGGTDQTFNMQAGRILQKNWRKKESFIIATEFLMGTDGRKMSKSWRNAIWLDDNPNDMFIKVMAIDDGFIMKYFALATNWPLEKIDRDIDRRLKSENPINVKKDLAFEIVEELYDEKNALTAKKNFEKTVQKGERPNPPFEFSEDEKQINIIDYLTRNGFTKSKSVAKQLLRDNAISQNSMVIHKPLIDIKNDDIIKYGQKSFTLKLKKKLKVKY